MSETEPLKLPDMLGRLKRGAKVFVILHKDALRERIDVRASEVLGLEDDVLFLAQTRQPVDPGQIGTSFEVAMLLDADQALRPVGYVARLLNILDDYLLPDYSRIQALAISAPRPEDFFETSLRMHYRVPVDEDMGVLIHLEGLEDFEEPPRSDASDEFNVFGLPEAFDAPAMPAALPEGFEAQGEDDRPVLLDFSAGGARVRLPGSANVKVGDQLPFKLVFLGSGYADGLGIVRSAERTPDNNALDLGLFFTNMDIRDIRYLERMVARIVSACRQRERDAEYS